MHRVAAAGRTTRAPQVNYRTPIAVGFLIGSSFMMVQLMLVTAVVSGSEGPASGVQAVTAFASLLLITLVRAARGGGGPGAAHTGASPLRVGIAAAARPPALAHPPAAPSRRPHARPCRALSPSSSPSGGTPSCHRHQ